MKKIISMMLAVAMVITFMIPAMASSSASADLGLENAIKAVKEKIVIPEDYKKFTYNINNHNGDNSWRLQWSNEEKQKDISVSIDENNFITDYYSYEYTAYEKKIPKYSKEQGHEIAEKFINIIDPKLLSQYKLDEKNDMYTSDTEYNYNYTRQKNGIDYARNDLRVTVNSYTGKVTNYYCNFSKDTTFEDASKLISKEQAKKAFIDKLGLKLAYMVKTGKEETENEKSVTYLAYIPKDSSKYIDALTGEVETGYNSYDRYYSMDEDAKFSRAGGVASSNANVALTPDEISAVKGISDLMSKEDADKKIRGISFLNLDSGYELTNAYLSKGWDSSDLLIWSLNYSKVINKDTKQIREISVSIEAKSGDVQSFWTYYPSAEGAKPQKTREQAKTICDDVLKNLVPNNYAKLKFDDTFSKSYEDKTKNSFTFRYVRMENGLECPSNYINISYDNLSGNVTNMDSNWIRNLNFVAPNPTISLDKAYEVLFDEIGYGVRYITDNSDSANDKIIVPEKTGPDKAVLGYFVDSSKPNIISAATGDILSNSGEVYKENTTSDYTDIKGLKAENQIKILTQMSIGYNEKELKPNENLLQKDYFLILSKLNNLYYLDQNLSEDKAVEQMYNTLISQGIITKADKAPLSTLTREEAAKYFVKFLKFGQVAEIKGIYKADFKDTNKINPDLIGYVCLASGLKAMNGSDGNFNPKSKVTRLEGLLSIYSYLSNK